MSEIVQQEDLNPELVSFLRQHLDRASLYKRWDDQFVLPLHRTRGKLLDTARRSKHKPSWKPAWLNHACQTFQSNLNMLVHNKLISGDNIIEKLNNLLLEVENLIERFIQQVQTLGNDRSELSTPLQGFKNDIQQLRNCLNGSDIQESLSLYLGLKVEPKNDQPPFSEDDTEGDSEVLEDIVERHQEVAAILGPADQNSEIVSKQWLWDHVLEPAVSQISEETTFKADDLLRKDGINSDVRTVIIGQIRDELIKKLKDYTMNLNGKTAEIPKKILLEKFWPEACRTMLSEFPLGRERIKRYGLNHKNCERIANFFVIEFGLNIFKKFDLLNFSNEAKREFFERTSAEYEENPLPAMVQDRDCWQTPYFPDCPSEISSDRLMVAISELKEVADSCLNNHLPTNEEDFREKNSQLLGGADDKYKIAMTLKISRFFYKIVEEELAQCPSDIEVNVQEVLASIWKTCYKSKNKLLKLIRKMVSRQDVPENLDNFLYLFHTLLVYIRGKLIKEKK